jgi:HPr kinase/phosphorylase
MITVHAACCALDGAGILIRGPSGSGKSSLALLLAAAADGAFVADDRVVCTAQADRIIARPHDTLAGRVEVRGQGILSISDLGVAFQAEAALRVVVDLVETLPRMPEPHLPEPLLGFSLPRLVLDAGVRAAGLAPLLIRAALREPRP